MATKKKYTDYSKDTLAAFTQQAAQQQKKKQEEDQLKQSQQRFQGQTQTAKQPTLQVPTTTQPASSSAYKNNPAQYSKDTLKAFSDRATADYTLPDYLPGMDVNQYKNILQNSRYRPNSQAYWSDLYNRLQQRTQAVKDMDYHSYRDYLDNIRAQIGKMPEGSGKTEAMQHYTDSLANVSVKGLEEKQKQLQEEADNLRKQMEQMISINERTGGLGVFRHAEFTPTGNILTGGGVKAAELSTDPSTMRDEELAETFRLQSEQGLTPYSQEEFDQLMSRYNILRAQAARIDAQLVPARAYEAPQQMTMLVSEQPDFAQKNRYDPDAYMRYYNTYNLSPDMDPKAVEAFQYLEQIQAGDKRLSNATEQEVQVLAYLLNTGMYDQAYDYARKLRNKTDLIYTENREDVYQRLANEQPVMSWFANRGDQMATAFLAPFQAATVNNMGSNAIYSTLFAPNQRISAREPIVQEKFNEWLNSTPVSKWYDKNIGNKIGYSSAEVADVVYGAVTSGVDNLMRDLPSLATGNPMWQEVSLIIMGSEVGSQTMFANIQRGMDPEQAIEAAVVDAVIEYMTEKIGGEAATKGLDGRSLLSYWAKTGGAEATEELMGALMSDIYTMAKNDPHSERSQAILALVEEQGMTWQEATQAQNKEQLKGALEQAASAWLSTGPNAVADYTVGGGRDIARAARLEAQTQRQIELNNRITASSQKIEQLQQQIQNARFDEDKADLQKELAEEQARLDKLKAEHKKSGDKLAKNVKKLTGEDAEAPETTVEARAKAKAGDLGEGKTIKGIAANGDIIASDDSTVKAADVDWESMPQAKRLYDLAMEISSDYGVAPGVVYASYNPAWSLNDYREGITAIASHGFTGGELSKLIASNRFAADIDRSMAQAIYTSAAQAGEADVAARVKNLENLKALTAGNDAITFSDAARDYLAGQPEGSHLKDTVEILSKLFNGSGLKIHFFLSEAGENGVYSFAAGTTNAEADTISIDLNAGKYSTADEAARSALLQVAGHELTHVIATRNPEGYRQLQKLVANALAAKGDNLNHYVEQAKANAKKNTGKEMTTAEAMEEAVAQASEMVLKDSEFAKTVAEKNPGLAQQIRDYLHKLGDKIRGMFKGSRHLSLTSVAMEDAIKEYAGVWDKALEGALESGSAVPAAAAEAPAAKAEQAPAAAATAEEETTEYDEPEPSAEWDRYSTRESAQQAARDFADTDDRVDAATQDRLADLGLVATDGMVLASDLAELIEKEGYRKPPEPYDWRYSVRTIPTWIKAYEAIKGDGHVAETLSRYTDRMMADDAVRMYVPTGKYNDTVMGPIRSNDEYRFTFDMDATCPRCFQYVAFRDRLQKIAGRPLTSNEAINLMYLMKRMGQEIPCTYCYVENKRILRASYYLNFFKARQGVYSAATDAEALSSMYSYDNDKFVKIENAKDELARMKKETDLPTDEKEIKAREEKLAKLEKLAASDSVTTAARKVFTKWRDEVNKTRGKAYNPSAQEVWSEWQVARNSVMLYLDEAKAAGDIVFEAPELKRNDRGEWIEEEQKNLTATSKLVRLVSARFGVEGKEARAEITDMVNEWQYDILAGNAHNFTSVADPSDMHVNSAALMLHRQASSYASSASSARKSDAYQPYAGNLIREHKNNKGQMVPNVTAEDKEFIMAMGGFRKHSSNDFRLDYVLDYFQFYADLAAGEWTGHTYTKNVDFVKIFGRCGDRINMSIAMETRNGKIYENTQEGMAFEDAQNLQKAYRKNVGVMAMVTDNAQLSYALNEDWIDMIIPFHASSLPKEVWYDLRAWFNYTPTQSESYLTTTEMRERLEKDGVDCTDPETGEKLTGDKITALFNDHFDIPIILDKNGHRVKPHFLPKGRHINGHYIPGHNNDAKTYLELCEKYGVKPRFAGLMVSDKNGNLVEVTQHENYVKLLKETAATNEAQEPIKWNFDQYDENLKMSPLDYAMQRMREEAAHGGYASSTEDPLRIVDMFTDLYLGKGRPVGWMPSRKDAKEGSPEDLFWARMDETDKAYGKMYHVLTDAEKGTLEDYQQVLADETKTASLFEDTSSVNDMVRNSSRSAMQELDADYMAAVQKGDMETAQRMVDEAAERALAGSKIRSDGGKLLKVYHGSDERFNVFDVSKGRSTMDIQGLFFSPYKDDAQGYGSNVRAFYLDIENPATSSQAYKVFNQYRSQNEAGIKAREELASMGYDGVDADGEEYIAFRPEQVKSADPVTYDDKGKPIPLSERFNPENPDIRYSTRDNMQLTDREVLGESLIDMEQRKAHAERSIKYYQGVIEEKSEPVKGETDAQRTKREESLANARKQLATYEGQVANTAADTEYVKKYRSVYADLAEAKKGLTNQKTIITKQSKPVEGETEAQRIARQNAVTEARNRAAVYQGRIDKAEAELDKLELDSRFSSYAGEERVRAERAAEKALGSAGNRLERMIMEQRQRFTDYRKSRTDAADRRRYLDRINDNAGKLMQMLTEKSVKKHVVEPLQAPLAAFLDSLNMYSKRQNQGKGETQRDFKLSQLLQNVRAAMQQSESMASAEYAGNLYLPQDLISYIDDLARGLAGLEAQYRDADPIVYMDNESLKRLDTVLRALRQAINDINRSFESAQYEHISDAADAMYGEMMAMKKAGKRADAGIVRRHLKMNLITPVYFFDRLGKAGTDAFNSLRRGYAKFAQRMAQIEAFAEETWKPSQTAKWRDTVHDFSFTHDNGTTASISLTEAQIMTLYMYDKRPAAMRHVDNGGGVKAATISRGNKKIVDQVKAAQLTRDDIREIVSTLTPEQKAVCDAVTPAMKTMGDWGNEVSMARFGYRAFGEDNYFPILTSDTERGMMSETGARGTDLYKMLNMSFTKSLDPKASNSLLIDDFFTIFANHASDMAKYSTMALPVLDTIRILNYRDKETGVITREGLRNAYGGLAEEYLKNFLSDLSSATRSQERMGSAADLIKNAKVASVAGNLSVVLKQGLSIARAGIVMPELYTMPTRMIREREIFGYRKHREEMLEHSGIARWKSMNYYDMDTGRPLEQRIAGNERGRFGAFRDKVSDIAGWGAETADTLTLLRMWAVAKQRINRTRQDLTKGSDEYWKAVTELFEDAVYRTQVVDGVMNRSDVMRSKSTFDKLRTAFMAEPILTYNTFADAVNKMRMDVRSGRKVSGKAVGLFARAFLAYAINGLGESLISAIMKATRDDDDYTTWAQKFLAAWLGEGDTVLERLSDSTLVDGLNPLGWIPLAQQIINGFKGESSAMDTVGLEYLKKVYDDAVKWAKWATADPKDRGDQPSVANTINTAMRALSYMTGSPAYNVARDAKGIWNSTVGEDNPNLKIQIRDPAKSEGYGMLYDAILAGDDAEIARLEARLKAHGAWDSTDEKTGKPIEGDAVAGEIKKRLKKDYLGGAVDDKTAAAILDKWCGTEGTGNKSAAHLLLSWAYEDENTDSYSQYTPLRTALLANDAKGVQDAQNVLMADYGIKEKDMPGKIKEAVNWLYNGGMIDRATGERLLATYGGYDALEIDKNFDKADYKADNPDVDMDEYNYYQSLYPLIDNNQSIKSEAARSFPASTEKQINSAVRSYIKSQYADAAYTRAEAEKKLVTYGISKDANAAYWTLEEWDFKAANPDDSYSYINELVDAMDRGRDLSSIVRKYTSHGKEAKNISSQLTTHYKPLYKANPGSRSAIEQKMVKAWQALGYSQKEIQTKLKNLKKNWLE